METKDLIKKIVEENPNLSAKEIGKIVNLHRSTVSWYLKRLGIKRDRKKLQKLNNTTRSFAIIISNEAEQIILGSILGDGSVSKWCRFKDSHKNLNSYLSINHTSPQLEYLLYKKNLLEQCGIRCGKIQKVSAERLKVLAPTICGKHYTINDRYSLCTRRAITFNKYRNMFYKGKKYINRYIYKLNALGLAIWYMDDGYTHVNTYFLCTNCFDKHSLAVLQNLLKHNFNIETTLNKSSSGGYIIHIKQKCARAFTELVEPYVCPSMKYKLIKLKSEE